MDKAEVMNRILAQQREVVDLRRGLAGPEEASYVELHLSEAATQLAYALKAARDGR